MWKKGVLIATLSSGLSGLIRSGIKSIINSSLVILFRSLYELDWIVVIFGKIISFCFFLCALCCIAHLNIEI